MPKIKLPPPITDRCVALINLGNLLQLFNINLFMRAYDVEQKLTRNDLLIHDVQDIQRLCKAVMDSQEINEFLREDVLALSTILDLFIEAAAAPTMPCGMWAMAEM